MSEASDSPPPETSGPSPEAAHQVRELVHDRALLGCRYDPTGRYVAAGSQDNNVVRWELESGSKTVLAAHDSWIRGLAFSHDGKVLISGGYDGRLVWWDNDGATEPIRRIQAHDGWIRAIDVSVSGELLATAGNDNLVKLFRIDSGEEVGRFSGHEQHVYSVMFHPDGTHLLTGDLAGKIHQWNLASHESVRSFDGGKLTSFNGGQRVFYGGVRGLSLSRDGSRLAAGGLHKASNPLGSVQEPLIVVFDFETCEEKLQLATSDRMIVWRVIYHADDFLIAVAGSSGGSLFFFRGDETEPFHKHRVAATAFDGDLHPDGLHVATAHADGKVRITRLAAG